MGEGGGGEGGRRREVINMYCKCAQKKGCWTGLFWNGFGDRSIKKSLWFIKQFGSTNNFFDASFNSLFTLS